MADFLTLGLIGHPLSHSLSPTLHKAALKFSGLSGTYDLFDIAPEKLQNNSYSGLMELLPDKINGFSVTIPHKEKIYSLVTNHSLEALATGAVNTVKVGENKKLYGHNTDLFGFKESFQKSFDTDLADKEVFVIGAGGAARAVIIGLVQMGAKKIIVKARDINKTNLFIAAMKANINHIKQQSNPQIIAAEQENIDTTGISALINASSIGLKEETIPSWLNEFIDKLPAHCVCFDLVYRKDKSKTPFTAATLAKKLSTIDGLPMLAYQAKEAFKYWTNVDVPSQVFLDSINISHP